jgi:hypothetical protein
MIFTVPHQLNRPVLSNKTRKKMLKCPMVSVRALTRAGSDHTPLLIDAGRQAHVGNKIRFTFELSWLEQDGFHEMIAAEWAAGPIGKTPIQTWQNKIRHLRRFTGLGKKFKWKIQNRKGMSVSYY